MDTNSPELKGRPFAGSKPPGTGYLYIAVIMFVAIAAGTFLSGGSIPYDPNSQNGPPTLPPYYGSNATDNQKLNFVSQAPDPKNNLQLKTFNINVCGSNSAFEFLIDTSDSMQDDGKLEKVKSGLQLFVNQLAPTAVVGVQTFSATVKNRVSLGYLKNIRSQVISSIKDLKIDGWTRMRDGFQTAKMELATAVTTNKFPGYKYYLIVLSDGVPESTPPRTCKVNIPDPLWGPQGRCFANEQDPRIPTNLATDIKNIGVEIYALGMFSQTAVSDTGMKPYLDDLLNNVVSAPTDKHYLSTDAKASNLSEILGTFGSLLCQGFIGTDPEGSSSAKNYVFPTFPVNVTNAPVTGPGGAFN